MITTLTGLANYVDATYPTVSSISHRLYKDTQCGAHLSVRDLNGEWYHSNSDYSGLISAVQVGSICEQCDAEWTGDVLATPFSAEDYDAQVKGIDDQVHEHWLEFHDDEQDEEDEDEEDEDRVEVHLLWSDPDALYLGSQGETTAQMTRDELWALITEGKRGNFDQVVTSIIIWTEVPPRGHVTGSQPEPEGGHQGNAHLTAVPDPDRRELA